MTDYLLQLGQNPTARKLVRGLGLPVPLPARLQRSAEAWAERELEPAHVAVGGADTGDLGATLGRVLAEAGAQTTVVGSDRAAEIYRQAAEAWARPVRVVAPVAPADAERADALLFDASGLRSPDALRGIYEFFHNWVRHVRFAGRIVVVSYSPHEAPTAAEASARTALEGFTRSLAKETGRKGITANLLYVERKAKERLVGPLRFLLSDHAAFISAQPLAVTDTVRANTFDGFSHSLHGKVALVTGAARGIGEEIALKLAREGAHVLGLDRPGEESALSRVTRAVDGSMLLIDITDPDAPHKIQTHIRERHRGVDIVVHNAGVTRDKTLGRMKPDAWDITLRVNLNSVLRITEQLLSEGLVRDQGRLVFLSSVGGIAGNVGQSNYAASKAGLIGYARYLAPKLAGQGITVNALAPGFIETKMTAAMPMAIREVARRLSALGQGGQASDVAEAATFLAMPLAHGITGSVLRVCGGALIGA